MTTAEFVKAAQAGDRRADEMMMPLLGWMLCDDGWWKPWRGEFYWQHVGYGDVVDVGPTGDHVPHIYAANAARIATGTDGRLLVEVLDALVMACAVRSLADAPPAPVLDADFFSPDAEALRRVAVLVHRYTCNRFIAACAALLAAKGELEEK